MRLFFTSPVPAFVMGVLMLACSDAPAKPNNREEPTPAAKADAPAGSYVRLKRAEIVDRYGFEKPMRAVSVLIPTDWTISDQVQWAQKAGAVDLVTVSFKARSADGKNGLDLLPRYSWSWSDNPMMQQSLQMAAQNGGAPAMPPMQAKDFLAKIALPNVRRGAKVLGFDKMPHVDDALQAQAKAQMQMAQQYGLHMNIRVDHARAHLTYTENGATVEEWLTAAVYNTANDYGMGYGNSYTSSAMYIFAFRAPEGELVAKDKLFQMLVSSTAVDAQWQARVTQVQQNITAINQKGAADRQKIIAQTNADINRTITEGYESRQRSQDRSAENFTDYIRGVQRYQDTGSGEQMKLTSGYDHVWSSGNGEYVFTDTHGFDPSSVLKGNWTELKAVPNP